jgi:3-hydroxybutyryl-CoA dehydratase
MNTYDFDHFEIGTKGSFQSEITKDKMNCFLKISGDENPMHMSDSYAQEKGFRARLVYGMLTASLYSTLAGMYLPGEKCILKSVETYFQNPVYVGDILNVSGVVKEKDERFQQVTVKAKITNQNGKTVSKATILVGFYE